MLEDKGKDYKRGHPLKMCKFRKGSRGLWDRVHKIRTLVVGVSKQDSDKGERRDGKVPKYF